MGGVWGVGCVWVCAWVGCFLVCVCWGVWVMFTGVHLRLFVSVGSVGVGFGVGVCVCLSVYLYVCMSKFSIILSISLSQVISRLFALCRCILLEG